MPAGGFPGSGGDETAVPGTGSNGATGRFQRGRVGLHARVQPGFERAQCGEDRGLARPAVVVPANPELSEQVAASGRLHNAAVRIQRRGGDHGVMLDVQVERRQYDQAGQVGIICKRGDRGWVGDESLHPPLSASSSREPR